MINNAKVAELPATITRWQKTIGLLSLCFAFAIISWIRWLIPASYEPLSLDLELQYWETGLLSFIPTLVSAVFILIWVALLTTFVFLIQTRVQTLLGRYDSLQ
jgi:hypothetical protein